MISIDTIGINNQFWQDIAHAQIPIFGRTFVSPSVIIALIVVLAGIFVSRSTKFGRTVFAIGGNEQSAILMGLPVARTKILIYTFSGFCAALAGIVFTFYTLSGYALNGANMEMDAIATVVIGGTLLTGGLGSVLGTVFGVMVYGTIQVLIAFQGTLNSLVDANSHRLPRIPVLFAPACLRGREKRSRIRRKNSSSQEVKAA